MPEGRQSPDPETQSGAQLKDPQAKPNDQGADSGLNKDDLKKTAENLESNPKHILEDAAKEKTSKSQ